MQPFVALANREQRHVLQTHSSSKHGPVVCTVAMSAVYPCGLPTPVVFRSEPMFSFTQPSPPSPGSPRPVSSLTYSSSAQSPTPGSPPQNTGPSFKKRFFSLPSELTLLDLRAFRTAAISSAEGPVPFLGGDARAGLRIGASPDLVAAGVGG